jgi:hypothetical protein
MKLNGITEAEALERIPCGREAVFNNRLRNIIYRLRKSALVSATGQTVQITELGLSSLRRVSREGLPASNESSKR